MAGSGITENVGVADVKIPFPSERKPLALIAHPALVFKHSCVLKLVLRRDIKSAAVIWPLLTVKSLAETFHGESVTVCGGAGKFGCVPVPGVRLLIITAGAA